jgi:hypothetical protein
MPEAANGLAFLESHPCPNRQKSPLRMVAGRPTLLYETIARDSVHLPIDFLPRMLYNGDNSNSQVTREQLYCGLARAHRRSRTPLSCRRSGHDWPLFAPDRAAGPNGAAIADGLRPARSSREPKRSARQGWGSYSTITIALQPTLRRGICQRGGLSLLHFG